MVISTESRLQILGLLDQLYGPEAPGCLERIEDVIARYPELGTKPRDDLWNQRDVLLITYANQVRWPECVPLEALKRFLVDYNLAGLFSTIHLLPFFPYSSDDGFSVIDYRQVDPKMGDWESVARLGESFDLMIDLVLNHCSRRHRWFEGFLAGELWYARYFVTADSSADLSQVARPRSTPLLTACTTADGLKQVWTTFSEDQVDLNWANPDVLLEMLDILLSYVSRGARFIRLDAVAYLWKRPGTSCIHLAETHAVVKLLRAVLDAAAPGTLLVTETNVPHEENISYFGQGDEAHVVYQFSLAPLLLDAILSGDASVLSKWMRSLRLDRPRTTFLNFTASHDGIGMRPLEGLLPADRAERLIETVRSRGGLVSTRRQPDGSDTPYELNITYFSALADPDRPPEDQARAMLLSQAVMLALRGIPAVYFHSLVGTPNYMEGVTELSSNRAINRRQFDREELSAMVASPGSAQQIIFDEYRRMLAVRVRQPAFHPDGPQDVLVASHPAVLAVRRTSPDGQQQVLLLANLSTHGVEFAVDGATPESLSWNLLTGAVHTGADRWRLGPHEVAWMTTPSGTPREGP
ncbi:MAG: alpha-amylase family glycosyl hydrolase [Planctomycetota bacterium]